VSGIVDGDGATSASRPVSRRSSLALASCVNERYWTPKLKRNVDQDRLVTSALEAEGWRVILRPLHRNAASAACGREQS
jgi:hypothetical protein